MGAVVAVVVAVSSLILVQERMTSPWVPVVVVVATAGAEAGVVMEVRMEDHLTEGLLMETPMADLTGARINLSFYKTNMKVEPDNKQSSHLIDN